MTTIQNTTPPSYLGDNTLYPDSSAPPQPPRSTTPRVIRSVVNDEGLPEVVNSNQVTMATEYYDAPIPVESESDQRYHNAPIPVDSMNDDAPPLPDRKGAPQHTVPYSPDSFPSQRQSSYGGYSQSSQPPAYHDNSVVTYVTPLDQLGDHPKFVDCPFCRHRVETRVKKTSSKMTHVSATVLGFTTIAGAAVPYAGKWHSHTSHYCSNCDHKVAMRRWGSKEMKAMGTPDHMREAYDFGAPGRKLTLGFPGNLPYEVKPFEVEEVLGKNGFDSLDKIHISIDPVSARNPGYCFVDFHDRETAEKALSSLSATIYGRPLKVGPCEPKKPRDQRGFRDEASTSRRWGDWTRSGDGGSPNSRVNNKENERGPNWALDHFEDVVRNQNGRRLYVGGLDKMIDQAQHQQELAEIFSGFKPTAIGKRITPHESKKTQPGNHHYCFVDFETKEEASSAVEALNGKEVAGGQLKVSVSERMPSKLVGRQLDSRDARRMYEGGNARNNSTRPNKPESNNAMVSNNWRRKD
ncbi:hypothetical protein FSARC_8192 [Fusarium sarcochroum]|uniref:RNA-binding protein n=1 Tax=Fusarium sarcochroum TaxID=1208366 RepID=A0A8H4TTM8_9HYPO|nr:hypothetical protein FSARC_8192 [Fusarium sarcochroum]